MIRKWMVFALSAGLLVSLGAGVGILPGGRQGVGAGEDHGEGAEANGAIIKGTRTPSYFKKYHKDVQKSAKELVKLAKQAKPFKDALKKAKDEKDPQKKWNELMDEFIKTSEKFEKVLAKSGRARGAKKAKDAFRPVTKSCTDCHTVFRVDEEKF